MGYVLSHVHILLLLAIQIAGCDITIIIKEIMLTSIPI
jgi:hypothetical protein